MNIIRADILGFCMGVRRAVDIAVCEADNNNIFTLGPLVHNPKVLQELNELGIKYINEIPDNFNSTLIIRAHGISPKLENELHKKGARIIDATCPKVKKSQEKVQELAKTGYNLFLAGEKNHAEIEGILGYSLKAPFCVIVGNAKEAEIAAKTADKNNKTALIGQTTISQKEYDAIADTLKKYFPNLEVINSICSATTDRQQALRKLLIKADAIIVIGGKDSANTQRLFSIAQESGKPCILIENAGEIPIEFYKFKTIGLCAGASTPDSSINEIETKLLHSC